MTDRSAVSGLRSCIWKLTVEESQRSDQVGPDAFYRKDDPLTIGNVKPEPDLAVIHGPESNYDEHHATTVDGVIEVSVTTAAVDETKADIYSNSRNHHVLVGYSNCKINSRL